MTSPYAYNLKLNLFALTAIVYTTYCFSYTNFTVSCRKALDILRVRLNIRPILLF